MGGWVPVGKHKACSCWQFMLAIPQRCNQFLTCFRRDISTTMTNDIVGLTICIWGSTTNTWVQLFYCPVMKIKYWGGCIPEEQMALLSIVEPKLLGFSTEAILVLRVCKVAPRIYRLWELRAYCTHVRVLTVVVVYWTTAMQFTFLQAWWWEEGLR